MTKLEQGLAEYVERIIARAEERLERNKAITRVMDDADYSTADTIAGAFLSLGNHQQVQQGQDWNDRLSAIGEEEGDRLHAREQAQQAR